MIIGRERGWGQGGRGRDGGEIIKGEVGWGQGGRGRNGEERE